MITITLENEAYDFKRNKHKKKKNWTETIEGIENRDHLSNIRKKKWLFKWILTFAAWRKGKLHNTIFFRELFFPARCVTFMSIFIYEVF
jgi:hypothetical protein